MFQANDADALLAIATQLATEGLAEKNELKIRSAVSRAYYAVFLLARQKMRVTTAVDVHAEVGRRVTFRSKLVGDSLYQLKEYRQSADYSFPPKVEHQDWEGNWKVVSAKSASLLTTLKRW